ncbi:hypothetical protein N7603_03005 [Acholeplasma vituli]|uniref:ABC transporter permease n=2 Tax=Paracholeplasma vituli TaxID=69473 RepID=A0ABT2PUJ3_9MOLU|nr:hypothetical protein [Paracholeplasma vituli]
MMVVISLALSMKGVMEAYYIHAYQSRSEHIDLEMTTGPNSSTRYFSTRDLDELNLNNHANVFKIDTLTNQDTYLTVLATNPTDFEILYGEYHVVSDTEIILTDTGAKKLSLEVGDTLSLTVGSSTLEFTVKAILQDYGIFQGDLAYIAHDPHVATLLKTLVPPLEIYPNTFFSNFNNTVYFDTFDVLETQSVLTSLETYKDLDFKESLPMPYIKQLVNRAVSLFQLMLIFIGLAVFLLIQTTFVLVFKEKEQSLSIIKLLGGSLAFGFIIWAIEMVILMIPAALISYLLTYGIIQIGLMVLMPGLYYQIAFRLILLSLGVVLSIFILTTLAYSLAWKKQSEVSRLSYKPDKSWPILVHCGLVVIVLALYFIIDHQTLSTTLTSLLLSIVLAYSLLKVISHGIGYFILKFKDSSLPYLFKMTYVKKSFYRFMTLALATYVSVILLFQTTGYIRLKASYIEREYQADLLVSNVLTNIDTVEEEIALLEGVDNSTKVGIFRNVAITPSGQTFSAVYMLAPNEITSYFGMSSESNSLVDFQNTSEPSIWLPMRYQAVYGIKKDDIIHLDLNKKYSSVPLKVVGFFDEAVGNTAFINVHQFSGYEGLKQTHILIKTDDPKSLQQTLMHNYGHRLIYIYDFQAGAKALSSEVIASMNYATFVILIILVGLLLSLLNQGLILFDELKSNYMRVSLLGYSTKNLSCYLLIEGFWMMVTLSLSTAVIVCLIDPLIKPLLLLFDEYEKITFMLNDFWIGLALSNGLLLLTRIVYLKGLRNMDLVRILKMHQMA